MADATEPGARRAGSGTDWLPVIRERWQAPSELSALIERGAEGEFIGQVEVTADRQPLASFVTRTPAAVSMRAR